MDHYEEKLKRYMQENHVSGEHHHFSQSCHSVQEAALAVNADPTDLVKNICMVDSSGGLIVAIVNGEDKVSITKVAEVLGIGIPRMAKPDEIISKAGYPCGGTPSFGFPAVFLIDERVMEKEFVWTSGGSENSLVKIASKELLRANGGRVVDVRK